MRVPREIEDETSRAEEVADPAQGLHPFGAERVHVAARPERVHDRPDNEPRAGEEREQRAERPAARRRRHQQQAADDGDDARDELELPLLRREVPGVVVEEPEVEDRADQRGDDHPGAEQQDQQAEWNRLRRPTRGGRGGPGASSECHRFDMRRMSRGQTGYGFRMPRGYMEGPASEEAERRLEELERGPREETAEQRLAVIGSTEDDPQPHFLGW